MKQEVSKQEVEIIQDLKNAITYAFSLITPQMLSNMSRRTCRRIQLCADNDGLHTDILDN